MYINPRRSALMHRAPVSQYQCHPGRFYAAAAATAALLTVDVHRWQHHGHLGSTPFVVAGGRKEEMILKTSRGGRSPRVKTQLGDGGQKNDWTHSADNGELLALRFRLWRDSSESDLNSSG